jgi:hypothetical protein
MLLHNKETYPIRIQRKQIPIMEPDPEGEDGAMRPVMFYDPHTKERVPVMSRPDPIFLAPGISKIDKEHWDEVVDGDSPNPLVKYRVSNESLVVVSKTDDLPKGEDAAIAIVNVCFDEELVRSWLTASMSGKMREAIDMQLLKITDPEGYERKFERERKTKQFRARRGG